ncbi:MAG: tubulin-like doman-containing protein [Chitinophagales bacterium]|nr:tubulin-like doman-containing protein [Chitinophagales bacterium]
MTIADNHVVIGLGGTGGAILKSFRKKIFAEYNQEERRKLPLGYLYVDSSQEMMDPNDPSWKVLGENAQLGKDSQLFIRGASLKAQLDNVDNYPGIKHWIGNRKIWDNIVGNVADDGAAAQRRRLGRFLFSCKIPEFLSILQNQVEAVRKKTGQNDVSFHIFTGLAGGTGSGSIIDTIAQVRKTYRSNIGSGLKYKIFVYVLVPEQTPKPGWDKGYYHANGYAALTELNAISVGRFSPHDVTGQSDRVNLDGSGDFFNGCYLFTNTNENGVIVDTKEQLPGIVSDFLFQKLSLTSGSDAKKAFDRTENFENISDWKEYDENAKSSDSKIPVRSKRFLSFGIKRIEIPEEEIVEYFTYNFTKQVLLQFKYNNWSDDLGYRDQPRNEDYHSFINDKNTIRNYNLSDDHLTLSLPILKGDESQNWKTILEDWNAIVPILKTTAWENSNDKTTPLNQLSKFCEERYEKNFRKVGVSEFYKIKRLAKKEIAKEIAEKIEKSLFEEWKTGQRSVAEISKIIEVLIGHSETRLGNMSVKLNQISEEIEKNIVNKNKNEIAWSQTSVISDILGKRKKIFEAHGTILQALYTQKTYQEAWAFSKELMAEIINQLLILSSEITRFSEKINSIITQAEKIIASRCDDTQLNEDSFKEAIVKYYEVEKVKQFNNRILQDENIQKRQTSDIRNKIVDRIGNEPTFTKLNERVSDDYFLDVLENTCKHHSIAAHNELITSKKDKIIGVNIVEKLHEQFGNDQSALNDFVRNIVKYSGCFINFENGEVQKFIENNDAPRPGVNIKLENVVISLPFVEEKKDFVEKLKNAFVNAIPGGKTIIFDDKSEKKNEICIMSMAYCFPLRAVNEVTFLKQKYETVLRQTDKEISQLVLHMEGDGTSFPKLFLLSAAEIAQQKKQLIDDALPYLVLAKALNIIQRQDIGDGTGKQVYGIAQVDELGLPSGLLSLGGKLTDSVNNLTDEIIADIKSEVQDKLRGEFLHISQRTELQKQIVNDVKEIVLPECKNNTNDSTYIRFYNAVKKSIEILKN